MQGHICAIVFVQYCKRETVQCHSDIHVLQAARLKQEKSYIVYTYTTITLTKNKNKNKTKNNDNTHKKTTTTRAVIENTMLRMLYLCWKGYTISANGENLTPAYCTEDFID